MSSNSTLPPPANLPSQEAAQIPVEVPVPASVPITASLPSAESAETTSPCVDKTENGTPKKGGWPKGKKRKKVIKDSTAPRQPLTGYVRFLNDRREHLRSENPTMPFAEITKVLAAEWSTLPQDQKQQYLTAAEQDRERYAQELKAYKQSDAYRIFSEQQKEQSSKKIKEDSGGGCEDSFQGPENNDANGCDIPIFTEDFLDHNKSREAELRQLRKSNTDYEQQNATIQTYISGLHTAIEKYTIETQQQRTNNTALRQYLGNLKVIFTNALAPINIPNLEKPNQENIEAYMTKVLAYVKDNPSSPVTASIRKAVAELDLQA